ncbi:GspE/PulE family protein [Pseudothauera rhizosphaerae]|uniref:Type II/IV secretion system protein n=1 Tax=Pseudothauera rhizosphaerae TaxID=2565932 RepID=A0A4S4AS39_9RHOO|nr:GspE/PulE family protein [Pseudothauera rhizosphaerae]THF62683.1 type II/IV secretion system protein [Pseudothauera rhizosphaerae]
MAVSETALINAGLQAGLFDAELVARLRPLARSQRMTLLDALTRELRMPAAALWHALAEARGLPFVRLADAAPAGDLIARMPPALLQNHRMLPMRRGDGSTLLATGDPDEHGGRQAAARALGEQLPVALMDPDELAELIRQETGRLPAAAGRPGGDEPVALFDRLLKDAWLRRASDIHVEAQRSGYAIRLRVDGVMQPWGGSLPRPLGEGLVSRIKVLADMDISETRATQDGGLTHHVAGWEGEAVEMRVASIPTRWGERLTLRILKSDAGPLKLDALGMPPAMLENFRRMIDRPHGIILVTGPTGSGKSTTLYAALRELDGARLNILTVEDPIEQNIDGISQVQVSVKVGFADALRSFLRHDPDIILVGEIRDIDTADTALKASTTGHLVFSTLHTNSALGAVARLADIGCERFLLADTLTGVIAQRLVRRLCPRCRKAVAADARARRLLGLAEDAEATLYEPAGCASCLGSGYRGRTGVFEALWMDEALAAAINTGANEGELRRHAAHWSRLAEDARAKVLAGETSLAEVRALIGGEPA